jgi:4-amino-4-deoxy-L-arabinose transferase-like glycosyltransferase
LNITITHPKRWAYSFIFLHALVWTLAPALVRLTLPMDSIECTIWGQQLQWGYDKNPYLNAFLTSLAVKISGHADWILYFCSQLSVAICMLAVWKLSRKMLPTVYALVALFLLETIQYFNLHAIDFNDNVLELAMWSTTTLFFYMALTRNKWTDWLLTGLFAGLGMMTKYYTAMKLGSLFLFLFLFDRKQLQNPKLYLAIAIFSLVTLPHIVWLFSHDFVTLDYAMRRIQGVPSFLNHIWYPLQFAKEQFETILPAILLVALLCTGKKDKNAVVISSSVYDKFFILFAALGPIILTLLFSFFTGAKLRSGWGQPVLSLSSIVLLMMFKPTITPKKFYTFVSIIFIGSILLVSAYCVSLIRGNSQSSAFFPGKNIAATLTEEWNNTYHRPLQYVAGARWITGNLAYYSKDHPRVYIDWNKKFSPWIDEKKLLQQGAIFVWDPNEDHQMSPEVIQKRFPHLGKLRVMHFSWLRNKNLAPVEFTAAFLPPATT